MTQQELLILFDYRDGELYRKNKSRNGLSKAGDILPTYINNKGYSIVNINNKSYLKSRIIFCMMYGYYPITVDHIDGNKSNNTKENLRAATYSENNVNTSVSKRNTSGCKGVSYDNGMWVSRVFFKYKKYASRHKTYEDAVNATLEKRKLLHKEFANNGQPKGSKTNC